MTESHHGDATVILDEAHLEVTIDIDHAQLVTDAPGGHAKLVMTDRQWRDLLLCGGDLSPSMMPVREPARLTPPVVPPSPDVFELPLKGCCGLILGEVCSCAAEQAEGEAAFGSPLRWGWTS